jgi:peptide/nickel transport system ATP-binding protein
MSEPFLFVKDLFVEYTSEHKIIYAVNGVSLSLERGKTLGLVGETGAGKTTIAKSILRILPQPPAKIAGGEIVLDGDSILTLPEKKMLEIRGQKVSMIFQDPMTALNPILSVGEQIAEAIRLHSSMTEAEARKEAEKMLEMVGIPAARYGEYPHQFSGGMKQRVVIAMALVCNPELLIADEPTTALDVTIQAQVLSMIKELQKKYNTAMILITHDLGVIAESCDDVAVIYAGEIVESGSKVDLFDHPTHPYTIGLFESLPDLNDDSEYLKPIAGMPPDPRNLPSGCKFNPRCPYATEACRGEGTVALKEISPGHFCRCINLQREAK